MKRCLTLLTTCALLAGCVTMHEIENLPTEPEHFELPKEKLVEHFPEVPTYEGYVANTPPFKQLRDEWGEPEGERTNWKHYITYFLLVGAAVTAGTLASDGSVAVAAQAMGIAYAVALVPPKYSYWEKGRYCIRVLTHRILPRYKKTAYGWKWTDVTDPEQKNECEKYREKGEQENKTKGAGGP
jgi:hypothetical protein